jgi:hypothetical protein
MNIYYYHFTCTQIVFLNILFYIHPLLNMNYLFIKEITLRLMIFIFIFFFINNFIISSTEEKKPFFTVFYLKKF